MQQEHTIVHVATGSREWERAAAEALVGIASVRRFDEPYSAVVYMSRNRAAAPSAVLIGLDELDSDERRLAAYARRAWPAAPVLVYGSRIDASAVPCEVTSFVVEPRKLASTLRAILGGAGAAALGNGPEPAAPNREIAEPRRRSSRDANILSTDELASLLGNRDL